MKYLESKLLKMNLQLFAEGGDPAPEGTAGAEVEQTVKKSVYDKTASDLSAAKKRIKELEQASSNAGDLNNTIQSLTQQLNTEKMNNQLVQELIKNGCSDIDYALYQIHKSNPDLALGEDGKLANLTELASGIKTSHPNIFGTNSDVEVKVVNGKVGGSTQPKGIMSKADIFAKDERGRYKLSASERQKAIQEHGDLFQN